jgi:hypothetical protein
MAVNLAWLAANGWLVGNRGNNAGYGYEGKLMYDPGNGPAAAPADSGSGSDPATVADYVPASPEWSEGVIVQTQQSLLKGSSSVKARGLIILGFLLACVMAFGQTDNAVWVKTFPGTDVGTKVTNAMATCTTNTAIPCFVVIDASLAVYPPGVLPAMCSHCFLEDYRIGIPGGSSINGITGPITIQSGDAAHFNVNSDAAHGKITLTPTLTAFLDLANTFTAGPQRLQSGSAANIAAVIQGAGVSTSNITYHKAASANQGSVPVAVGQWLIVIGQKGGSSPNAPVSTLGNNGWSNIANICRESYNCSYVWAAKVTVAGTDTIGIFSAGGSYTADYTGVYVISGLPSSAILDASAGHWIDTPAASDTVTISPTLTNDLVLAFMGQRSGVAGCLQTISVPFTTLDNTQVSASGVSSLGAYQATSSSPISVTFNWNNGCVTGGGSAGNEASDVLLAFKVVGTYTQTADLSQYQDSMGNVLSKVDANGEFNPPAFAGTPATTPAYGTHVWDSTNDCDKVYTPSGWTCLTATGARTAGTNGFYRIDGDGTITEWVQAGNNTTCTSTSTAGSPCLNNNTPTLVTLPHSITTLISATCTDNGPRVAAGNDQNIGASYSSSTQIAVNTPSTGVTASCIVVAF